MLCFPKPMWSLKEALARTSATEKARHPCFVGYEETRPIDYARLSLVATYAHFCAKCSVAREPSTYFKLLKEVSRHPA